MVEQTKRIVIVGASAAGLRCACRVKRLQPGWSVRVVEAKEVFSYGACGMPYVLSGDIEELGVLRRTPYGADRDVDYFETVKGVEILAPWRAIAVDPEARTLTIVSGDEDRFLEWDELVIATGASPRSLPGQPEHERIRAFHVWDDVKPLKSGLMRGEIDRVAVIGAGLVGCEVAEAFASLWGAEVTLVEAAPTPLPEILDAELGAVVAKHLDKQGVTFVGGSPVERFEPDDEKVTVIAGGGEVRADVAVVAVGVRPRVELAKAAGVSLGPTGAIRVDEHMATSVPHIWAAGDCAEVRHAVTGGPAYTPLGSLANRQGRILGTLLTRGEGSFGPVAGAAAVKVFDFNVASVGCTAYRLGADGKGVRSVWVSAEDRAHYWPEAKLVLLEMVYDPATRRVLGVQAVGEDGEVAKRIDVSAQLILRGCTIEDFIEFEHAYAPPYAPAVDPLTVLACAAQNELDGIEAESPLMDLETATVVDLRIDEEREERPIEAGTVIEIEIGELRDRIDEVPEGPLVVACAHGTRSAEAVRFLASRGIRARYLGGGMSWRARAGRVDS
jgi:NADPH-dependent 2,4-dienoyl-CoA reductase/sulfur reductase-like enzyme/rhodanese-related sulfurtransferase